MELEDALFKFMQTQAPVVALIGEPNRLRFYKGKIPDQSKMPALVQQRSSGPRTYSQCGVDGSFPVSMQLDSYAKTWAEMAHLARLTFRALNPTPTPYPMQMGTGNSPDDSVRVKAAELVNQFDRDDPEPGLFCRTQLWTIWIFEP